MTDITIDTRVAADVNPRSVWYVRRAIACYAIIKGR
jgi:hypothetical protein